MKKMLITTALLSAVITLSVACCEAKADSPPPNIEAGAYASSLPPIYPTQKEQQAGAMWGTTEIMHCPDGYKLSFDDRTPNCVPMTAQELAGGAK